MGENRAIDRRTFNRWAMGGAAAAMLPTTWNSAQADKYAAQPLGDGQFGSYTQPWFLDSFLEFADDLTEAGSNGKRFAIMWELDGCPYCRETHLVNFAIPQVQDYVDANFNIVQLDLKGSREVVNFDGKAMKERDLAKLNQVRFTPTIQFFPESLDEIKGKSGKAMEVARIPGYLRPYHFLTFFHFVREKAYTKTDYRKYLKNQISALKAEGKDIPKW